MKFELVVNLDNVSGVPAYELSRILRYWAGAAKSLNMEQAQEQAIYDSAYTEVGSWRIS